MVENGVERVHTLSIAEVTSDCEGKILSVEVTPYAGEIAGVEYVDGELRIVIGESLRRP